MKKSIFLIFFSVLLFLCLGSCAKEELSYTILFESNGGSSCESISWKEGETLILPTDPIREGYAFEGWFMDADFNKIFSVEQLLSVESQTLTLYAK